MTYITRAWSQPGIAGTSSRRGSPASTTGPYQRAFENLITTFNPTRFDVDKWADVGVK